MNYSFGFSWIGLLIVLLPMIPNLFYFLYPNVISSGSSTKKHLVLDIIEHGSQVIYIGLLIFFIVEMDSPIYSVYILGMAIFLFSYYILWIILFLGKKNLIILLCMAIFPVIYFVLAEIWLHNYLAIVPTVIFGIIHILITYKDMKNTVD